MAESWSPGAAFPADPLGPLVTAARSHGRRAVAGSTGAAAQEAAGAQPRGGPQALERETQRGLAAHKGTVATAPGTTSSYRDGSWQRNPPGSVHRPWRERHCTILVKNPPSAGYPKSRWIVYVSNNQFRDTRRFLNCPSPQWRNALIATGSLMARADILVRSPTLRVGLVESRVIFP